ncbi:MAG: hypothetical protein NPIRA04_29590 [Nitrospirales bacterium]|nr:MAG: hypothetical protein NPIRA04_29590 [Nitrospirales bacterium]
MLLQTNERLPLARLLQFIEQGERIAQACARAQSAFAPDLGTNRFFKEQARQEGLHAYTFQAAISWMAPRHLGPSPFTKPFAHYQRLIESALRRGDLYETILAEQVILEGLGNVTLKKLEIGLLKRQAPFQRLRRMFLQQEEAHHGFGNRVLKRAMERQDITEHDLHERAQMYLRLAESMILAGQALLVEMTEDPHWYLSEFHKTLPDWVHHSRICAVA